MKILLVIPPFEISDNFGIPYPIGVGYLATVLSSKGYDVRIIDCDAMKMTMGGLKTYFLRERPAIVGITATSYSRFNAIKIINMVKIILPNCTVLVGGPHFTATAEDALTMVKNIDFVIRGEGENTMLELAQAIEKGGGIEHIDGISYRLGDQIRHNKKRELIKDLDSLPLLNRDLVDNRFYYEKLPHSEFPCKSILASRGCPFNCAFCFPHDRSYRRRSAENIMSEIEYLLDRYKIEGIRFFDLTFTLNRETVINFCEEVLKRRLRFKWYCESRVDIDLGLLELMREAGCYSLDFGLESASKKVLKMINKKILPEQALSFAKKCKELGIKTKVFFMLSLPGETIEDAQKTYDFIRELSKYVSALGLQVTQIIPGTEVECRAKQLGILDENFSWNSPFRSKETKVFADSDVLPLYMEKLNFDEIQHFYNKYSIFDLCQIKNFRWKFLREKIWRAMTIWDKGIVFKLRWLILFFKSFATKYIKKVSES